MAVKAKMARPIKKSLDYFYFDVNFFHDRKTQRLTKKHGGRAVDMYIYLLTKIHGGQGYFLIWDKYYPEDICDVLGPGFTVGFVNEVMKYYLSEEGGLFDRKLFDEGLILTSKSIQKTYVEAKGVDEASIDQWILPEYNLLTPKVTELNPVKQGLIELNEVKSDKTELNPIKPNLTELNEVSSLKESKVKESKVKESKVKESKVKESKENESKENEIKGNEIIISFPQQVGTKAKPKPKPQRHGYGEYKNVMLSDEDIEILKKEFPETYKDWIERVSSYCKSSGKKYSDYVATIRNWAREKKTDKPQGPVKSTTENFYLKLAKGEIGGEPAGNGTDTSNTGA